MEDELEKHIRITLVEQLSAFVRIDNQSRYFDATWATNGKLEQATEFGAAWLRSLSLEHLTVEVLHEEGLTPLLLGVVRPPNAQGTVLFYGHLDKQPPYGGWDAGLGPYRPVFRNGFLYGRGTVDDGYALFLSGILAQTLQRAGRLRHNLVFFFETDEESGSRDVAHYLQRLSSTLPAPDLLFLFDAGGPANDTIYLTESLRGAILFEVHAETGQGILPAGSPSPTNADAFRVLRSVLLAFEEELEETLSLAPLPDNIGGCYHRAQAFIAEKGDVLRNALPLLEGVEQLQASILAGYWANTQAPSVACTALDGLPKPEDALPLRWPSLSTILALRLPPCIDGKAAERAIREWFARFVVQPPATVTARNFLSGPGQSLTSGIEEIKPLVDRVAERYFGRPSMVVGAGFSVGALSAFVRDYPRCKFVVTGCILPDSRIHVANERLDVEYLVKFSKALLMLLDEVVLPL